MPPHANERPSTFRCTHFGVVPQHLLKPQFSKSQIEQLDKVTPRQLAPLPPSPTKQVALRCMLNGGMLYVVCCDAPYTNAFTTA